MSQVVFREQASSPSATIEPSEAPALPDDLVSHALSFLSPEDLARASGVCREWNKLSADLWQAFDLKKICKVIDQAVWERHVDLATLGLDASGAPAIDKRVAIPFIKRLSRQVEGNAGVTLLTMPKGLTLNKLIALAAAPKQGPATQFKYIWSKIEEVLGNIAVDKTYSVAVTNSVLKDSRKKSLDAQRALVQGNGGELPGVLLAATLAILTYMSSPTRLYSYEPWIYTRCAEQIDGRNLNIGGFTATGLRIYEYDHLFKDYNNGSAVAKNF